jgi:hypothetical protein
VKRKHFFIIVSLIGLALLMPFILQAQSPDERVPPPPPYMPGELPPGFEKRPEFPLGRPPTSTPDPFEAEQLPEVTPSIIPTAEVINIAPEAPREQKYHLVIKRGKSGKQVLIAVPIGVDKEAVLNEYLNPEDGDEFVRTSRPMPRPPQPPQP